MMLIDVALNFIRILRNKGSFYILNIGRGGSLDGTGTVIASEKTPRSTGDENDDEDQKEHKEKEVW